LKEKRTKNREKRKLDRRSGRIQKGTTKRWDKAGGREPIPGRFGDQGEQPLSLGSREQPRGKPARKKKREREETMWGHGGGGEKKKDITSETPEENSRGKKMPYPGKTVEKEWGREKKKKGEKKRKTKRLTAN